MWIVIQYNKQYRLKEGEIGTPKYSQAFTKGSKKDMAYILNYVSTPLAKALDKAVWKSSTVFGSIVRFNCFCKVVLSLTLFFYKFFNPVMAHRLSSPIGTYLKSMKNIYCVVSNIFVHFWFNPDPL